MASITATPSAGNRGTPIVVEGDDFLPETQIVLTISHSGSHLDVAIEVPSDENGSFSTTDEAAPAVGTLTSDGVNVTADDTVTIGANTYVFKAGPTTVANQVKIGADAAATLANLKKAINLTGVSGTDYGSSTVIHPTVRATTITATTLKLVAKTGGTAGNSLALSEAGTHTSVSGANLAGGAVATGINPLIFTPNAPGRYLFTATDGTSTATATCRVSTGT